MTSSNSGEDAPRTRPTAPSSPDRVARVTRPTRAHPKPPSASSSGLGAAATKARTRPDIDLLLVSFLILFFELACIRWFSSTVIFLTFFTNIVLMACFLGMSVGCFAASRKANLIKMVLPLASLSTLLAVAAYWLYLKQPNVTIDVGNQQSPQLIYFGTEDRSTDLARFVIPLWAVAGLFFGLVALIFVGLGQVMGRAFDAIPNRVQAYTINVLGSLLGIVMFTMASSYGTSPLVWFGVCVALVMYFLPRWTVLQGFSLVVLLLIIAATAYGVGLAGQVIWSPYYKINYIPQYGVIVTNNIGHQQMRSVAKAGPAYALPHFLNRDAGGKPFAEMLIIGAGSGNDVASALACGVGHIDAVEIDPSINAIGQADHPDRPFQSDRVTIHFQDGRQFLKENPQKKYDLIVYALVDSLVLHSGYSSLRLESFLFTQDAFADVRTHLKDDGVFVMYNYFRQGWVVARLDKMLQTTFGSAPLVLSMPRVADPNGVPTDRIEPSDNEANHFTAFLVGNGPGAITTTIAQRMAESKLYWLNQQPGLSIGVNGFAPEPPGARRGAGQAGGSADRWLDFALTSVNTSQTSLVPTDDWPFLYLRDRTIPYSPSVQGMIVVAVVSLIILLAFAPARRVRLNGRMFFLGAGFMLLETKGVVHMALLFGSTWVVNSVVFAAILVMILLANLTVLSFRPRRLWPWYALLLASLAGNALIPMSYFLGLPEAIRPLVSCAIVFLPILFAGVIFATSFRDSTQPDVDMGSNIAGVILGGLSEYLSLVLGFHYLMLVAVAFYLLSAALRPRIPVPPVPAA